MALHLNRLNARQRDAVLHSYGPLLILAGAGSGKTSTMAHRVAYLMTEKAVPGSAILGLSFTNKAAKELKTRIMGLASENGRRKKVTQGLTITTFHSLCARLLRAHASLLGFQNNFTILDQSDQMDVLKQVLRNIKIDDRRFDANRILFEIGRAKNQFLAPQEAESFFLESGRLPSDYAIATASSFGRYQDQLRVLNAMDFDDLIFLTVELLEKHPDVREQYNTRFRYIHVDEYQDTNHSQFRILKLLTEKQQNLCVVGDDDQSIYAWRGADPSHILGFQKHYPAAEVITLDQNYRSTSRILEAANHVIEKNKNRHPKKLWSDRGTGEPITQVIVEEDRAEAEYVAEEIFKRTSDRSRLWKDFAVLYRSHTQSRVFEEAFRRRGIPYLIMGGLSFLDRKEVKDVLAYWRVIFNPNDDASLRRILNWPARGIGKTTVEALGTFAFQNGKSFFEALGEAPKMTPKAAAAILKFREMILSISQSLAAISCAPEALPEAVAAWARGSLQKLEAKRAIEEESEDGVQAAKRWENVEELIHSIGQFRLESEELGVPTGPGAAALAVSGAAVGPGESGPTEGIAAAAEKSVQTAQGTYFLGEFLNRMTLAEREEEKEEDPETKSEKTNQVTLLTLHSAKGLEFPFVFLVGTEEGFLPHQRTLDEATDLSEERRLCYVGMTRAKDFLYLTRAKNRIRYGKPQPRLPSRFIEDVPKDLWVKVDQSDIPDPSSEEERVQHEARVKNYLAEIRAKISGGKGPSPR